MILKEKINKTQTFKNYEQRLDTEGFEVEFRIVNDSLVTIQILGMPKSLQGKGQGTTIMNTLCKLADQTGVTLQLKPVQSSTHSRTKLIRFYSKFGFIENKGKNQNDDYQYMYRFPKKQLQEKSLKESEIGTYLSFLPRNTIKKINQKYRIKKILDEGTMGIAYLTDDNKVVKLTQSSVETEFFLNQKDKQLKHFVHVYDIKKLLIPEYELYIYIILKDYVPKLLNKRETFLMNTRNIEDENLTDSDIYFLNQLQELQDELFVSGNNDLTSENIGWKDNILVGFDFHANKRVDNSQIDDFEENALKESVLLQEKLLKEEKILDSFPKEMLQKLYERYNIVKLLASGENGSAFLTNDGKVVKITTDNAEVKFFINKKKQNLKHFVKIYEIKNYKGFFIILKDYVPDLLDEDEKNIMDSYMFFSQFNHHNKYAYNTVVKKLKKQNKLDKLYFLNQLVELKKELHINFKYNDLKPANIGWKDNILVAFDLESPNSNFNWKNIEKFTESVLLEKKATYKYGAVMLNLSCSKAKSIQQQIDKKDLYEDETDKYGLERENHVTLLYGLHEEVTTKQVKEILDQFEFQKNITAEKISLFENEKYDVLKFDMEKKYLSPINKKLTSLPYTNEYPDYKPHMTVAYVKKGRGKKYVDMFKDIKNVNCKVENVLFSHSNKKDTITIKKKENLSERILKEVIDIDRLPEFVAKIKTLERKFEDEGCNIDINFRQEQSIQLSKILIPKEKRNEQLGTKFMNELISLADEFGITITLSASDSFGSNLNRLTKFYQRFGFRKNTGRKADHRFSDNMIREPKGI